MVVKFGFRVFLILILSFIFYFGSSLIFPSNVKAEDCGCSVIYSCQGLFCDSCDFGINCSYSPNDSCAGPEFPCTTSCEEGVCQPSEEEPPPAEPECDSGPCCDDEGNFRPPTYVCDSWTEYGCHWGTGCGSDYGRITYEQRCSESSSDCDGNITDSDWQVSRYCSSWEICSGSGCACSGSCLNEPTGPSSPFDGSENIKLPVTLRWNSVSGAISYRFEIEGVNIDDNVITTNQVKIEDCVLKSNTSYNWKVQACCDSGGNSCGPWNNTWNFP